ncbi:substrate binding domain of ABC-type glycine betaine transport system-domain-containing protein [Aspergillus pseudodeflectus]|uniref:Substrate binding domain of ABC-type glycine betaine transport system-domain-containing protein n=1 Tax=Aspergillus pseudodeflectus TaxID=176178 RepID=A0ABR4KDY7_9EURO
MTTIKQGRIDLSFHHVAGEVVKLVLERLGYNVQVESAPHEAAFALHQESKTDFLIAWLEGSHGQYLDKYRTEVTVLSNAIYSPYCIWGVPDYVPETVVQTTQDLLKPNVAAKMRKQIQGINPGAGISRFSKEIIDKYGLAEAGYSFQHGSQADCFETFEAAYENNEWLVVPLWHPQYLHKKYKIRSLEEPNGLLRGIDDAQICIHNSAKTKFTDEALAVLQRITLGNEAVSLMDCYCCKDGLSPRKAALRWMHENESRVNSWFAPTPYERLQLLGLPLPVAPPAVGQYEPFMVTRTGLVETSLQLPWVEGKLAYEGRLGSGQHGLTVSQGAAAAKICALNLLAQLHQASSGDLSRVRMIRLEGHVNSEPGFRNSPSVFSTLNPFLIDVQNL